MLVFHKIHRGPWTAKF